MVSQSLVTPVSLDASIARYQAALLGLPEESFEPLLAAADELLIIHRALLNDGQSVLTELLRDVPDSAISCWQHYPPDDSLDEESGARFYYHAHEVGERPNDEHGHFHLFVRSPLGDGFSHLVACSLAADGRVRSLFTTNRWVTDEQWCPAPILCSAYREGFVIDRARPSWLVVRWLMALVVVLSPCIDDLLIARDEAVASFDGGIQVIAEDRDHHVLSEMPVELLAVLGAIQQEALRRYPA